MPLGLILDLLLVRRQHVLQPLVSDWQTMRVPHVHQTVEESTFLGTTVVEKDQRVLDRHNTVVDALMSGYQYQGTLSCTDMETTYIQQQQPGVRLVHDPRLNERELLLSILLKLLRAGVPILLRPRVGNSIAQLVPILSTQRSSPLLQLT